MAQFILNDWEVNGYHDSDFQYAVYDDQLGKIICVEYGSTRYGAPLPGTPRPVYEVLTPAALEAARILLRDHIFAALKAADYSAKITPNKVGVGQRVRFLVDHKNQEKEDIQIACDKCNGTGNWVNPRNKADVRSCFACKGTGKLARKGGKVKVNGKCVWKTIPAGTEGVVVWEGTFRTIYRSGYLTYGRGTIQCKVKLDDGSVVNAPLEKLSTTIPLSTDEELLAKADEFSYSFNFKPMVSAHGGWLDRNVAYEAWLKFQADK